MGANFERDVDRGRAVAGADDGDRHRLQVRETERERQEQREEDAELAGGAEQQDLRLSSSGLKSVIAPMPMKINSGNSSLAIPML